MQTAWAYNNITNDHQLENGFFPDTFIHAQRINTLLYVYGCGCVCVPLLNISLCLGCDMDAIANCEQRDRDGEKESK